MEAVSYVRSKRGRLGERRRKVLKGWYHKLERGHLKPSMAGRQPQPERQVSRTQRLTQAEGARVDRN
jgi:hypothetical protein